MRRSERVLIGLVVAVPLIAARLGQAGVSIEDLGGDQFRVTVTYAAPADTKTVHLAGSFNDWSMTQTPMIGPDADGRFVAELVLPKGEHEYKFVVDGSRWEPDPDNPEKVPPYSNAILRLGVGEDRRRAARLSPIDMARRTEHPPEFAKFLGSIGNIAKYGASNQYDAAEDLLGAKRFPWIEGDAVCFLLMKHGAEHPLVTIVGSGFRTGYLMDRVTDGFGFYALSLRRSDIPPNAAYQLEFERGGKTERIIDPRAHTVTTRNGQPKGVIAAPDPKKGCVHLLTDVASSGPATRSRNIYVYLPPGYDANQTERYPVLYAHDGQNLWDDPTEPFGHGGWQLNATADRLIAEGKVRPFIAVGIPNSPERMKEYGPGGSIVDDADHAYLRYMLSDVRPLVDQRFRTSNSPKDTAIMGSSMGGIISLQAALLHPDVFGAAACLSPAFQFKDADGKTYSDLVEKVGYAPVRLYIDHGTAGTMQDGAPATEAMVKLLRKTGWQDGRDLEYFVDTGADHNERAWRARLERPLQFLFSVRPTQAAP